MDNTNTTDYGAQRMAELRGVMRAGNQIGEPWPVVQNQTVLTFTAGSPATGYLPIPTGARAFTLYNRTDTPVILSFSPSAIAGPTAGGGYVESKERQFYGFPNSLVVATQIATVLATGMPTTNIPVFQTGISYAFVSASTISPSYAGTASFCGGAFHLVFYRP